MRLQIDVNEEQLRHIENLMTQTGVSTKKDLFNYSIHLFEWAVEERMSGKTIASLEISRDQVIYHQFDTPALRYAAKLGQSLGQHVSTIPANEDLGQSCTSLAANGASRLRR